MPSASTCRVTLCLQVTFGGTNAPICHGAGLTTNTLSDLVVEVSYIDAKGDLQTVNDPVELRAASGAFGLLGVVVSVTIQLDQMGVTDMVPVKLPLPLAIPPPKDYAIPAEVQKMIDEQGITEKMLEQAKLDFIQRCEDEYYLEWFWFPYQNDVWVNSWTSGYQHICLSILHLNSVFSSLERPITPQDRELNAYPGDSWLNGVKSQQVIIHWRQVTTHAHGLSRSKLRSPRQWWITRPSDGYQAVCRPSSSVRPPCLPYPMSPTSKTQLRPIRVKHCISGVASVRSIDLHLV